MDKTPPEIWTHIFSYACLDSGQTGRSISLVSRSFSEMSAHVKLQSIALLGRQNIHNFVGVLRQISPHLRCVRYLYMSSIAPSDERFGLRPIMPDNRDNDKEVAVGMRIILEDVAEHLEILEMDISSINSFFRTTQPLFFPRLTDFTTYPCDSFVNTNESGGPNFAPCPTLRRVSIMGYWTPIGREGRSMWEGLGGFAPAVTHLQFLGNRLEVVTRVNYFDALVQRKEERMELPACVESVVLKVYDEGTRSFGPHFWSNSNKLVAWEKLRALGKAGEWFTLLEIREPYPRQLEREWLDRLSGEGGWV